jgi:putative ABC transport system permease protein
VAVIGVSLVRKLFKKETDPLGKVIQVGSGKYRIVGILQEKGASMGGAGDKIVILPVSNVRQQFSRPNMSFAIHVSVLQGSLMDVATGEAEGVFRQVRGLSPADESDFNITKSDSLVEILIENMKMVSMVGTIIGLITLFGASIGFMNIMLVSVSERTREIGIRKAIGAKAKTIKQQFLYEAVVIGQLGGVLGVVLGILLGNIMSMITKGPFIVPWLWMFAGLTLCFCVGLISGIWPAVKASRLDPIEALRYE